jgi:hypothetical protein
MTNHTFGSWQALVERDVLVGEDFLLITHRDGTGQEMVVPPLKLVPRDRGTPVEPTISADACHLTDLLQALLDAAWAKGLRPRGYEGPQETKAIMRHLEDMRAMAFAKMEIKAP